MDYQNEHDELQKLHKLAAKELGKTSKKLIVWVGGDAPNQQDELVRKFTKRFPGVPIQIKVDLSKYHNIRVYQELLDGRLTPDVVMLQTMNDFENWRDLGVLESFMPQSFPNLTHGYSDPGGAFLGAYIASFVPQYAKTGLTKNPATYSDFLSPEFKGRLVLTPPHDDDAVLFVYDHILQRHGEDFLRQLAAQKPKFLRGTAAPAALVGHSLGQLGRQKFLGNITGYFPTPAQPSVAFVPTSDFFITWAQRAAMFKLTQHKAAARLFLAYITSHEYQSSLGTWSTRQDVAPPSNLRPLDEYPNTNLLEFIEWMRDRQHLHELRAKMQRIFGPVRGPSPVTDSKLLKIYRRWS